MLPEKLVLKYSDSQKPVKSVMSCSDLSFIVFAICLCNTCSTDTQIYSIWFIYSTKTHAHMPYMYIYVPA